MLLKFIIHTVDPEILGVGNVDQWNHSMTIANGFNRWNFKSAICRTPYKSQSESFGIFYWRNFIKKTWKSFDFQAFLVLVS